MDDTAKTPADLGRGRRERAVLMIQELVNSLDVAQKKAGGKDPELYEILRNGLVLISHLAVDAIYGTGEGK